MLTIYHNPRCRKSRETLKLIEEAGEMVQVVEYLKMPLSTDELEHIVQMLGISPIELIRKEEKLYKEEFKNKEMSDEDWLQAMSENPVLMQRPVVVKENRAIIGRPPENVEDLF